MMKQTTITTRLLILLLFALAAASFCPNKCNRRKTTGRTDTRLDNSNSRSGSSSCCSADVAAADSKQNPQEEKTSQIERIVSSSRLQRPQGDSSSFYLYQPATSYEKDLWSKLCPPLWNFKNNADINNKMNNNDKNLDVTVIWTDADCPKRVANEFLESIVTAAAPASVRLDETSKQNIADTLTESLKVFRGFCRDTLLADSASIENDSAQPNSANTMYKARLLATRGPSGTKCPQWHIDHVPVRWIQCLLGPGCHMVNKNNLGVNWSAINGLVDNDDDDDDGGGIVFSSAEERNKALVDTNVAEIYVAKEHEAALLLGNRWNECSKDFVPFLAQPAVHKSPSQIPFWQGRVLLTQDVIS